MFAVKNIGGNRRQHQRAGALAEAVADRISIKQPRHRSIVHRQQGEDPEGGNNLHPGKHHLAVHHVGKIAEKNPPADADHAHQTEDRCGEHFAVANVHRMGDLMRDNDLVAEARQACAR